MTIENNNLLLEKKIRKQKYYILRRRFQFKSKQDSSSNLLQKVKEIEEKTFM